MKSPDIYLREFAARRGTRVIERLCFDANVGEQADCYVRCQVRGLRIELEAATTLLVANIKFVERPILFAVNKHDYWGRSPSPIAASLDAPVYADLPPDPALSAWFANLNNCAIINGLNLGRREAVFVFANSLTAIGEPTRDIETWLRQLADLVFALPAPPPRVSASALRDQLPDDLKPLAPLLPRWAIGDDAERSERVDQMSQRRRRALIAQVQPLLPLINAYLDSFRDRPMPEAAVLVGELAELVAELLPREA